VGQPPPVVLVTAPVVVEVAPVVGAPVVAVAVVVPVAVAVTAAVVVGVPVVDDVVPVVPALVAVLVVPLVFVFVALLVVDSVAGSSDEQATNETPRVHVVRKSEARLSFLMGSVLKRARVTLFGNRAPG